MKSTCLIAAVFSVLLQAQSTPPAATPKFDVVSIKRCQPGAARGGDSSPGRLSIGCALLADVDNTGLIQQAYNRYAGGQLTSPKVIPIEGGPDWIHSETFEIDAKSDGHPSILMMLGPMMQAILEDRFKLKIHRETRQGPVYELALGKGSPKLKPFQDGSCTPVLVGHPLPPLASGQHYCRNMVSPRARLTSRVARSRCSPACWALSWIVPLSTRPALRITSRYTSSFRPTIPRRLDHPRLILARSPPLVRPDAPGIFQAIQEQLGLKLVPAKGPVDVLVIDHIERPSEN
jgi:uncharacterized protein (TIGR03435 family)